MLLWRIHQVVLLCVVDAESESTPVQARGWLCLAPQCCTTPTPAILQFKKFRNYWFCKLWCGLWRSTNIQTLIKEITRSKHFKLPRLMLQSRELATPCLSPFICDLLVKQCLTLKSTSNSRELSDMRRIRCIPLIPLMIPWQLRSNIRICLRWCLFVDISHFRCIFWFDRNTAIFSLKGSSIWIIEFE